VNVGVASSEPETDADGGLEFFATLDNLGAKEVRLVLYRDNPSLVDKVQQASAMAKARGIRASCVLIDSPENVRSKPAAEAFARWARGIVAELPHVYRFIVWNEPNAHSFWRGPPRDPQDTQAEHDRKRAQLYRYLLDVTSWAINRAWSGVEISGYALAASHFPIRFLAECGAKPRYVNSLSLHLYPGTPADSPAGSLVLLVKLLALVPRIPVHIDEFGWNVGPRCTEETQAWRYSEFLASLRKRPRVKTALVYRLRDGEGWAAGPIRPDGSRRPSFDVLRAECGRGAKAA
jgi:hypothetical protein